MTEEYFKDKNAPARRSANLFDAAGGQAPPLSGGLIGPFPAPPSAHPIYGEPVNSELAAAALATARLAAALDLLKPEVFQARNRLQGAETPNAIATVIIDLLPATTAVRMVLAELIDLAEAAQAAVRKYLWSDQAFLRELNRQALSRDRREVFRALAALLPTAREALIVERIAADPAFALTLYISPVDPAVALDLTADLADLIARTVQDRFGFQDAARRRALAATADRLRTVHKSATAARDRTLLRFDRPDPARGLSAPSVQADAWAMVDAYQARNGASADRLTAPQADQLTAILEQIGTEAAAILAARSVRSAA